VKLPSRYTPTGKEFSGGGMSKALVCEDGHLERLVLVKGLAPGTDPKRILDELRALQAIRSKHVVQIYDVIRDEEGNVAAIVEEYLPGNDLTAIKSPKGSKELLTLIYAIAEGISDVHAHGLLHRDIKRQNMKFDVEGCLKIFDFGLARDTSVESSTMGIVGTPGYMAPELFQDDGSGKVLFTSAIDTYAFAATILAIAYGKLPACLSEMPPKLPCADADFAKLPQGLPLEISYALNQCLEPIPSKRPLVASIAQLVGTHLARDRHRALLISQGKPYFVDKNKRVVKLSVANQGSLTINYDGLRFILSDVTGDVAVNNMPLKDGEILPDSCVIVLGAVALGPRRTMVTVDVSHPEVIL
jgi:serine/threonine protein kinase